MQRRLRPHISNLKVNDSISKPHKFHLQTTIASVLLQKVMIIVGKLLRSALPFHPLLNYLKSTEPVKPIYLSKDAQQAVWANHFINTITKQPLITSIEQPSLRDKLINSPNPIADIQFDQAIKKEMTGIFTKGVNYSRIVFDQERMTQAEKETHTIAFYPSVLVTTPIFQQLRRWGSRMMFQGTYGIGKTISFAFFIYLSNIINKYALLAARSEKNELQKEYEYLVGKKYLPQYNVKYWYWTINWELAKQKDFSFQKIYAEQATELTDEERKYILKSPNVKTAQKFIKQYYKQANIQHMAFLDQIDHAIPFIKKWNQFLKNHPKEIELINNKLFVDPDFKSRLTDEKNQNLIPANKLKSLARQFTAINQFNYILNSWTKIESHLLDEQYRGRIQKQCEYLTLDLKTKSKGHPLKTVSLNFQEMLEFKNGKICFWHFFCDLLEEKLQIQPLEEQEMKRFKIAFLQYVCSLELKGYYRFLHIRLFLQRFPRRVIRTIKGQEMDVAIKKIVSDFGQATFQKLKNQIQKFIGNKKDSKFKRRVLRAIYIYATRLQKQKTDKLEVDLSIIGFMVGQKDVESKLRSYFIQSQHNLMLIPIDNTNYSNKIVFQWSAQDFIHISQEILFPGLHQYSPLVPKFQVEALKPNLVHRETTIESLIGRMLVQGSKFIFHTVENVKQQKTSLLKGKKNLSFKPEEIQISRHVQFDSFNPKHIDQAKNKSFEDHFSSVLEQCEENPEQWIASLPTYTNLKKKEDVVLNNPSVDFALAKCTINNNNETEFIVYTFDSTIAFGSVSQKESKSKDLLLEKAAGLNKKIQIRHHILCLQKRCAAALPISQNFSIYYSSIDKLQIQEAPTGRLERRYFEQVRTFIIGLYENLY